MIVTEPQGELRAWLCDKIGLVSTPHLRCFGWSGRDGLMGVVGFDQFNGASVVMHAAGSGNWVNRQMLFATFNYPFNVCQVNMVIGLVPSGNTDAIRFNTHLGFKVEAVLEGAHPDGALWLMTMKRGECRYLKPLRKTHGQEISSPAA